MNSTREAIRLPDGGKPTLSTHFEYARSDTGADLSGAPCQPKDDWAPPLCPPLLLPSTVTALPLPPPGSVAVVACKEPAPPPDRLAQVEAPLPLPPPGMPRKGRVYPVPHLLEGQTVCKGQVLEEINLPAYGKRYEIKGLLGRGAFGSVYGATDEQGNEVAIKWMPAEGLGKREKEFLRREVCNLTRVHRYPHVVTVVAFLKLDRGYAIVMERLAADLKGVLKARGSFSEDAARSLMWELLLAVAHCHSKGVSHRDLKPGNILLRDANVDVGGVVLADFGLSRAFKRKEYFESRLGSVAYSAPDVLAAGYDDRPKAYWGPLVDAWALGCIAYELLNGRSLFWGRKKDDCARNVRANRRQGHGNYSAEAKAFIDAMTHPNPGERLSVREAFQHPWLASEAAARADYSEKPPLPPVRRSSNECVLL